MRLGTLLASLDLPRLEMPPGSADLDIAGLASDSRSAAPGFVFFAVPGHKADGLAFIPDAVARGAVAVVTERYVEADGGVPVIDVPNVRLALARAAARFTPGQPRTIVAVTGTSGKTSVTAFARQIWTTLGHSAASLGTIGVVAPTGAVYGSLTTPDPITLHATLDRLEKDGVTHLAVEASSHGLHQHRLDGLRLAAAGFTNLSRDHLDYHATENDYLAAKLRLFDALLRPGQPAVINADDVMSQRVQRAATAHHLAVFTTGRAGHDIHLQSVVPHGYDTLLTLNHDGHIYEVTLPLAGEFQVANALLAAGLCIATGSKAFDVMDALGTLEGAAGRLDRVGTHNHAPVFIDYAHKPDALKKVLETLRPYARGRLIVVFGCGGDRDAGKRPLMGAIAAHGADVVIVTDDNPRSEDPAAIRAAVLAEAPQAIEIGDRRGAIETAVAMLKDGDVLVVAGKGHETGQIVGAEVLPFSDHDAARAAIASASR